MIQFVLAEFQESLKGFDTQDGDAVKKAKEDLFWRIPNPARPQHLAYVEWFTPFGTPHKDHGMYKVTRLLTQRDHLRRASIVPVEQLERSCQLIPEFGTIAPRDWTSANVLEQSRNGCPSAIN